MGTSVSLSRKKGPLDPSSALDYATRQYVDAAADTFLPVANGTHFNGNGGSTITSLPQGRLFETRKLLRVIAGGADTLQVEWANIWTSNTPQTLDATCEMAGPNSVSVRMGIEYPAGNMRMTSGSSAWNSATAYVVNDQVTSGGSSWVALAASTNSTPTTTNANWRKVNRYLVRWDNDDGAGTVTFAAGDYRRSLPLALVERMVAGDMVAMLGSYDTGSTSNRVPYAGAAGASNTAPFVDWVVLNTTAMPGAGSAMADTGITTQTNGNTTTANSTDFTAWMKIPYATALTGNSTIKRCIALFGDSLMQGTGGDIRDGEPAGLFVRSVDNATWWRIAQGGNQASCYTLTNAPWQMSCVARCSATIVNLGINDIQAANNFATTQAKMLRAWKALAAQGPPVFANYFTPISLSSDSWATTANQTRWTTGGASAFPGTDAEYLTSVYGQIAMWMSQDGALDAASGARFGQANHPLQGILECRALLADPSTSWKWNATYTTDGAHPKASAVAIQVPYLAPQVTALVITCKLPGYSVPSQHPAGVAPLAVSDRSLISAKSTGTTGSYMTVVGVSPGRIFIAARLHSGASTNKLWTLLIGSDANKLKAVDSGTITGGVDILTSFGFTSAIWIPAGYLVALQITRTATSNWGGIAANNAAVHKTGSGFLLAGTVSDTAVISTGTVVSLYDAKKYTNDVFRVWAELI
jgi:hypothetical protein